MGEEKTLINIIGMECPPEGEAEFNHWYNEIHIPLVLGWKGIKSIVRGKLVGASGSEIYGNSPEYPNFVAIYEWVSKEAFEAYDTDPNRAVTIKDTQDIMASTGTKVVWRAQYEPIRSWTVEDSRT